MSTNATALYSRYKPLENSALRSFALRNFVVQKPTYTLAEVLVEVRRFISNHSCFDETNPAIIVCNAELEEVFRKKSLHVSEVRAIILEHLEREEERNGPAVGETVFPPQENSAQSSLSQGTSVSTTLFLRNTTSRFLLNENLRKALSTVHGFNREQTSFLFQDIVRLTARFMTQHGTHLVDSSNPDIFHIGGSLLGSAFQVDTMHKSQFLTFIAKSVTLQESTEEPDHDPLGEELGTRSSSEDERPYVAGGGTTSDSQDTSLEETKMEVAKADTDTDIHADNEADNNISESQPVKRKTKCINCKKDLETGVPYCSSCWSTRKQWTPRRTKNQRIQQQVTRNPSSPCDLCSSREKNTSLIHGNLGHMSTCYPCAKKLWKKQGRCPICRRRIEKIVKIIVS